MLELIGYNEIKWNDALWVSTMDSETELTNQQKTAIDTLFDGTWPFDEEKVEAKRRKVDKKTETGTKTVQKMNSKPQNDSLWSCLIIFNLFEWLFIICSHHGIWFNVLWVSRRRKYVLNTRSWRIGPHSLSSGKQHSKFSSKLSKNP